MDTSENQFLSFETSLAEYLNIEQSNFSQPNSKSNKGAELTSINDFENTKQLQKSINDSNKISSLTSEQLKNSIKKDTLDFNEFKEVLDISNKENLMNITIKSSSSLDEKYFTAKGDSPCGSNSPIKDDLIIAQYDSLLKEMAKQLQNQVHKNKELESVISNQTHKTTLIIENLRQHAEKEIATLTKIIDKNKVEKEEFIAKIERLEAYRKQALLEVQKESMHTAELVRNVELDKMNKLRVGKLEEELKKSVNDLTSKNIKLESEIRKKDEELYLLRNLSNQFKLEIETHKEVFDQLKGDYELLIKEKTEIDIENQKLASKNYENEILLDKLSKETEKYKINMNELNNEKNGIQQTIKEIKEENMELKESLVGSDSEKTQLKIQLEKSYRVIENLQVALIKAENMNKIQIKIIDEIQNEYKSMLDKEKSLSFKDIEQDYKLATSRIQKSYLTEVDNNNNQNKAYKRDLSSYNTENPRSMTRLKTRRREDSDNYKDELKNRYKEYRERNNKSLLSGITKSRMNSNKEFSENDLIIKKYKTDKGMKVITPIKESKKLEDNEDQLIKLKNNLQILLNENKELNMKYSKYTLGTNLSFTQAKRKQELEFELDLNEKNIQRLKTKIKEFQ